MRKLLAAAVVTALASTTAHADLVTYTENFDTGNANWADGASSPLDWLATGGPDGAGDGYVTTSRNFINAIEGDRISLFRGEVGLGSSDGAFAGNWLNGRVTEFSFSIRHDFVTPLTFFARFAGPGNNPAVAGISVTPVFAGEWTELTIQIDPSNPFLFEEGPPGTYDAAFSNIGNIQIGLEVPASLAGFPVDVTFDLDGVATTPAPGALAVFGLAGLMGTRRRRRN